MLLRPTPWLIASVLMGALSADAQVEKVAIRTTGVSCGSCAVFSEIYLRQVPGVDSIKISLSREAVLIVYKPGAPFRPNLLRDALRKTDVGVLQMQISARGHIERRGSANAFVTDRDRYDIAAVPAGSPPFPYDVPLLVEGILDDRATPMGLKVVTFRTIGNP